MAMKRYHITLNGMSPLLLHRDNIRFNEAIAAWRSNPANKEHQEKGDDRSPAWTWIGCLYHDDEFITMNADNMATCIREGGAKVPTGLGRGKDQTYKKLSQSGIVMDKAEFDLLVNGNKVPIAPIKDLIGELDFSKHQRVAEELGFELFVKRVRINRGTKHVRVRPLFRDWAIDGTITVLDEEMFKLSEDVLNKIFLQAGAFVGIGDWRPGSTTCPGFYGKFTTNIELIG